MAQRDQTIFDSRLAIDKIAVHGEYTSTVAGTSSLTPNSSLTIVDNPYGRKCFINATYSIDNGENYYDQSNTIQFLSGYRGYVMPKAMLVIGCDDTSIYICPRNGYHDAAGTGISLTFKIKYTLFSIS